MDEIEFLRKCLLQPKLWFVSCWITSYVFFKNTKIITTHLRAVLGEKFKICIHINSLPPWGRVDLSFVLKKILNVIFYHFSCSRTQSMRHETGIKTIQHMRLAYEKNSKFRSTHPGLRHKNSQAFSSRHKVFPVSPFHHQLISFYFFYLRKHVSLRGVQ